MTLSGGFVRGFTFAVGGWLVANADWPWWARTAGVIVLAWIFSAETQVNKPRAASREEAMAQGIARALAAAERKIKSGEASDYTLTLHCNRDDTETLH